MVDKGSIERIFEPSEWVAPSFIIPKQDGTVWFINDFRELNKKPKKEIVQITTNSRYHEQKKELYLLYQDQSFDVLSLFAS